MTRAWAFFFLLSAGCSKPSPAPAASAKAAAAPAPVASAAPATASGLAILKDFEGEIGWVAKDELAGSNRDGLSLTLLVKDGNFRVDVPAGVPGLDGFGKAYLLGKPKSKQFLAVLEKQKQVVNIDFEKANAQLEALTGARKPASADAGPPPPQLTKTGKTDTVAGYPCEIWQVVERASSMELCIANEPTPWFEALAKLPANFGWAAQLMDGKHFPLRFVAHRGKGESGRIELTRIEKKPLAAAFFEPPAGYPVIELEQMLRGLMQGMPGMAGARGAPNLPAVPPAKPGKPEKAPKSAK